MTATTICLYHANCMDGFSAAWAVWRRFGDSIAYLPVAYGDAPPDVTGKHVIMVDFSYKRPVIEAMVGKAKGITVLDHHKTAQDELEPLLKAGTIEGRFDMNRSGAVLAWEWFNGDAVPTLLTYVQDRDLWRFRLPLSRELNVYVASREKTFGEWDQLAYLFADTSERMQVAMVGAALLEQNDKQVTEALRLSRRKMTIAGILVEVANVPSHMASDAANILAQGLPFGATYFDAALGRVFSLRSEKGTGTDVSEIAKHYGGGGHATAAGFRVVRADLERLGLL